ncbi:glycosyltransferase family 4 protein [Calocera viscosa TUFC12733]|uniref:Glycosyltransferase family 4 protein n=1 Tax=Calocera viscosa (strain TUFC12733) TaxID=1330018 RepID=A0A167GVC8_CALVF|nr:glycosyltransferase family 4 protein [Calocera viscosa TUFC12733]
MISDLFHPAVGGVESNIYNLSSNLIALGHRVVVNTHFYGDCIGISIRSWPEATLHAHVMGVRTMVTAHSLFDVDDAAGMMNKLLEGTLSNAVAAVCASRTGYAGYVLCALLHTCSYFCRRENTVLRICHGPHVIPNAVVPSDFQHVITIVVVSRLFYRKDSDLLISTGPRTCALYPSTRYAASFLPHPPCSPDAFRISILEAASCGLFIVSTRVGGVPEMFPTLLMGFANPDSDDVARGLARDIDVVRPSRRERDAVQMPKSRSCTTGDESPSSRRTYTPYGAVRVSLSHSRLACVQRSIRAWQLGLFAGAIYTIILVVDCLWFAFRQWMWRYDEDEDEVSRTRNESKWEAVRNC